MTTNGQAIPTLSVFSAHMTSRGTVFVAPVEAVPPVLTTISPDTNDTPGNPGAFPALYSAAKIVPIVISVIDAASTVAFVVISVRGLLTPDDANAVTPGLCYAGRPAIDGVGGYRPGFRAASIVTGTGDPGVGFTFSLRADAGWPAQAGLPTTIEINAMAVDGKGNVLA